MLKDGIISYTQLDTYIKCPLKYKFRYHDKIKKPDSIYKIFGSAVHGALHYRNVELKNTGRCDNRDVVLICTEHWFQGLERSDLKAQDTGEEYDSMIRVLEGYLNLTDRPRIIDSEVKKVLNIADYTLIGYIDGVIAKNNGTVEVIEYKTSSHKWPSNRPELELQPDIYGLLLGASNLICNYDVLVKSAKPSYQWLTTTRTSRNFDQALKIIREIIRCIEGNIYYPRKSYLCNERYCEYTMECREW